jgi:hypothetical protein
MNIMNALGNIQAVSGALHNSDTLSIHSGAGSGRAASSHLETNDGSVTLLVVVAVVAIAS